MSICADCSNNFQDKQCLETSNSDTPFSDTELMGITKTMIACGYYNKEVAK